MKYKSVESLEYLKPDLINEFIDLLDKKDSKKLFIKIKNFHPSEIAYYIQTLDYDYRKKFINILSKNFDSRIFVELDQNFLVKIIDEFDYNVLLKAVKELESDDAASLIDTLDIKKKKKIYSTISSRKRISIEKNLSFVPNTAGRMMQSNIVIIPQYFNVEETIEYLRKKKDLPKVFYDLFVIDNSQSLIGIISLSKLISSKKSKNILTIMNANRESINSSVDQEDVAEIFRKRNLTSLAVVNDKNRLLGVINIEDVVDVIDNEAEEDLYKLAGVGDQSFYSAVATISRARFMWLFFNLIATFCVAFIIKNFEDTIQRLSLLAALMPVIASMGGCSGTQSLTTAVRAIAMKKLTWSNSVKSTGKEILIGLLNGIVFSLVAFVVTIYWFSDFVLSLIISISLFLNLIFGSFFGVFIPVVLTRLGVDPAFASGTFVITITDILGFFIFLTLASIYLI